MHPALLEVGARLGDHSYNGPPVEAIVAYREQLRRLFEAHPEAAIVKKGVTPYIDSYSAFFDNKKLGHTELEGLIRNKGITDVFCCGIAYDVCVGEFGFSTRWKYDKLAAT